KDETPADGIDGFRLDVAAEIPLGFWPEFRSKVREINPEAYLVGEVWWQKYPDDLMDPRPFLKGTMFDAVMNYRWYRPTRQFFSQAEPAIGPKAFADS
ncbi:MAG TPA: alpha-amylase, partial [Marinilabiliales bacterium]|nr:alpha-amylase [Marinilabiliales bacterium]